jgi:hypothetical protein
MSTKKPLSDTVVAAIIAGLFGLGIALISNWDKIFSASPSTSLTLSKGRWKITEKLRLSQDSSEIDWEYSASIVNNNMLVMKGQKIKVNDKEPSKNEKEAISVYKLTFEGNQAKGEYDELNSKNPVLSGKVKLIFTDTFTSFSGSTYENGKETSTLHGYKR